MDITVCPTPKDAINAELWYILEICTDSNRQKSRKINT